MTPAARPLRYGLFAALYLVQGFAQAFVGTVLLFHLYEGGLSKQRGGAFIALVGLPWAAKVLWGPLVDRWPRYGRWIAAGTLLCGAALLLLPVVEGREDAVFAVALLVGLGISFQDVATDAIAIRVLTPRDRGPAEAVMRGSAFLGGLLGGAGLLAAAKDWPWTVVCGSAAALIVPLGLILPLRLLRKFPEVDEPRAAAARLPWRVDLAGLWKAAPLAAVFLALLSFAGQGLADPVVFPWFRQLGYDRGWVSTLLAFNDGFKIGGVVLGGLLAIRLSRKAAFSLAAVLLAGAYLALGATAAFATGRASVFAAIMATAVVEGAYSVLLVTLLRDVTANATLRASATVFAAFMAGINLCDSWTAWVGGQIAEHVSIAGMFAIAGAGQLVVFVPLAFVRLPAIVHGYAAAPTSTIQGPQGRGP